MIDNIDFLNNDELIVRKDLRDACYFQKTRIEMIRCNINTTKSNVKKVVEHIRYCKSNIMTVPNCNHVYDFAFATFTDCSKDFPVSIKSYAYLLYYRNQLKKLEKILRNSKRKLKEAQKAYSQEYKKLEDFDKNLNGKYKRIWTPAKIVMNESAARYYHIDYTFDSDIHKIKPILGWIDTNPNNKFDAKLASKLFENYIILSAKEIESYELLENLTEAEEHELLCLRRSRIRNKEFTEGFTEPCIFTTGEHVLQGHYNPSLKLFKTDLSNVVFNEEDITNWEPKIK